MSFFEVKNMKFDNEADRMLLVSVLQSYFHILEAKFPFLACKCFHSPLATCQWLQVDEGRWGRVHGEVIPQTSLLAFIIILGASRT